MAEFSKIEVVETMATTSKKSEKLPVAQRVVERAILRIILRRRVRNEEIRRLIRVVDVIKNGKWQ